MIFLTGVLTVVLVLDAVLLILLVLIQLPKKEAGAGLAFGAGATDALFGAGSGNVLTKVTKYGIGAFFILVVALGVIVGKSKGGNTDVFRKSASDQLSHPAVPASAGQPGANAGVAPSLEQPKTMTLTSTNVELPSPVKDAASTNAPK